MHVHIIGLNNSMFDLFSGSDEGFEVWAVKEFREADHCAHVDPSWVWRQNDEEGNGGTVVVAWQQAAYIFILDMFDWYLYPRELLIGKINLSIKIVFTVFQVTDGWGLP